MPIKEQITLCVPTMNRADFLRRLLYYLTDTGYRDWIFLGDSSNETHLAETQKTIESLKDELKIRHFVCPGLSIEQAMEHITPHITTPYSAIVTDDDFICPGGIHTCIDFLENNPDYGAAHGFGLLTSVNKSGPYGDISHVYHYPQTTVNGDSGAQRLREYFATGPHALLYAIHRTPVWQAVHSGFIAKPWARSNFVFHELLSSVTSVVRNRVKELDCLYLVRFGHDKIFAQPKSLYDWFTHPDWYSGFQALHDRAVSELMRQDGIEKEAAETALQQALWPYLGRVFSVQSPPPAPGMVQRIKNIAGKMPGVKTAYERIIPCFMAKNNINLLKWLLSPSSPYYQDFLPIYRAITNPKISNNTGE